MNPREQENPMTVYEPPPPRGAWILRPIEGLAFMTPIELALALGASLAFVAYAVCGSWVVAALFGR